MLDNVYKVLMIGDSNVGKSSVLKRYTDCYFEPRNDTPTIGVDYRMKQYTTQDKRSVRLCIWDTAGQERFRGLTHSYYRNVNAIVMVYDVSCRNSFENLQNTWLREIKLYTHGCRYSTLVVCNKMDIEKHAVSAAQGIEFAESIGALFFECSAKSNHNITDAFESLAELLLLQDIPPPKSLSITKHCDRRSHCRC